jgi:uncharacterized protein with HEPN domain
MERDIAPVLQDILQSIERIEIVTWGKTLEQFADDWQIRGCPMRSSGAWLSMNCRN